MKETKTNGQHASLLFLFEFCLLETCHVVDGWMDGWIDGILGFGGVYIVYNNSVKK